MSKNDLIFLCIIGALVFLFAGDPDIHDSVISVLQCMAKAGGCK